MTRSLRPVAVGLVLAVAAVLPVAGPASANTRNTAADAPVDCPTTLPVADIADGMQGTGWTVVRGTDPLPFGVDILGTFPDGIAPGKDLILFRAYDVDGRDFIARSGGIWAGMSGSPVYVDGKLIGAVAYGFSESPSTLGGITPIADMLAVGDQITAAATRPVSKAVRRAVAAKTAAGTASGFQRLATPAVLPNPGLGSLRLKPRLAQRNRARFAPRVTDGILRVPGAGQTKVAPLSPGGSPTGGGNLVAALSSGLAAAYATGTTTWVCGDRVLAFGHPLLWSGRSGVAMMLGRAFDIVDDKTTGPYKLAQPTSLVGTVTQDRGSGIGGRTGVDPTVATDVHTTVIEGASSAEDHTVIYAGFDPYWQYQLAAGHGSAAVGNRLDRNGTSGTLLFQTQVTGHREDGTPFSVTFSDRLRGDPNDNSTPFSTTDQIGGIALGYPVLWLLLNPFENVTVDSVDSTIQSVPNRRWALDGIEARVNNGPWLPGFAAVKVGDRLAVRITLAGLNGIATTPTAASPRLQKIVRTTVTRAMLAGRSIDLGVGGTTANLLMAWNPYEGATSLDDWLGWFAPGTQQSSQEIAVRAGARTLTLVDTGRIVVPFDPTDPFNRITLVPR
ncbi:MAG: SpoIVB peptidase S55 domain-containing protein [Chloroflexota bacterium]